MYNNTFSNGELITRTGAYIRYHEELDNVEKLHKAARYQMIGQTLPCHHMLFSMSVEAEGKVRKTEAWATRKVNKKRNQACIGPLKKFNNELREAHLAFKTAFLNAGKKVQSDLSYHFGAPEVKINGYKVNYKKRVDDAWRTFKDSVGKGGTVVSAALKFESEIERARKDFETRVKSTMDDYEKRTSSSRWEAWGKFTDSVVDQYTTAVDKAVKDHSWWVTSAVDYFCLKFNQILEEERVNNSQLPMAAAVAVVPAAKDGEEQPSQSRPQTSKETRKVDDLESLPMEKLMEMLKKKMLEVELQSLGGISTLLLRGGVNSEQETERLDDLEKQLLDLLETVKSVKNRG